MFGQTAARTAALVYNALGTGLSDPLKTHFVHDVCGSFLGLLSLLFSIYLILVLSLPLTRKDRLSRSIGHGLSKHWNLTRWTGGPGRALSGLMNQPAAGRPTRSCEADSPGRRQGGKRVLSTQRARDSLARVHLRSCLLLNVHPKGDFHSTMREGH